MKLDKMGLNAYRKSKTILNSKEETKPSSTKQPKPIIKPVTTPHHQEEKKNPPLQAKPTDEKSIKRLEVLLAQKEGITKGQGLSGSRKAAEFLLAMPKQEAAKILQYMQIDEVSAVIRELAEMKEFNKAEKERLKTVQEQKENQLDGIDVARGLLKTAFGNEEGERILQNAAIDLMSKPFRFLEDLDNDQLLSLLKDESLEVLAVIIPRVKPSLGKEILKSVHPLNQSDLIKRIALSRKIEGSIIVRMEEALHKKLQIMGGKTEREELDGTKALADILRYMSSAEEKRIMDTLNTTLPDEAQLIEDKLFGIESLLLVQDRDLQEIFRGMTENELTILLKGKDKPIRKKILSNLSQGRRELIADEERIIGLVRLSEVDKATREFLDHLRLLEKQGKITLLREGEIYL